MVKKPKESEAIKLSIRLIIKCSKIIVVGIIIGYIIVLATLYNFQNNLLYFPQPVTQARVEYIKSKGVSIENVSIPTNGKETLKGWIIKSPKSKHNLLIYFGGNSEEVSDMVDATKNNEDWSMVLMNYRGYGESTGTPSEKNLFSDSLLIYDHFKGASYSKVIIMGRSLGSGVAIYLADNRRVAGLILATPYDSVVNVAKLKFPMIPVSLLLHERFESNIRAPHIKVPTLILMAAEDSLIPNNNTESLAAKFGGKVDLIKIPNVGHNTISNTQQYWESIQRYIDTEEQK